MLIFISWNVRNISLVCGAPAYCRSELPWVCQFFKDDNILPRKFVGDEFPYILRGYWLNTCFLFLLLRCFWKNTQFCRRNKYYNIFVWLNLWYFVSNVYYPQMNVKRNSIIAGEMLLWLLICRYPCRRPTPYFCSKVRGW